MPLATLTTQAGDGVTFEVSADRVRTWQEARRSRGARWHRHEVHLDQPRLEFLGPGEETLSLSIVLDAARGTSPADEVELLAALQATGQRLQFVCGGEWINDYVITRLDERWRRVNKAGVRERIEVELQLEAYA